MTEYVHIAFPNMRIFASARSYSCRHSPFLPSPISRLLFFLVLLASVAVAFGQPAEYAANKAAAEKFYAEGSYAKAHEVYAKMDISSLPKDDARWVQFRLADTQWRAATASANPDTSEFDAARDSLQTQIRDLTREDQHDRIWA